VVNEAIAEESESGVQDSFPTPAHASVGGDPARSLRTVLQAAPAAIALTRGAQHVVDYANATYGAVFGELLLGRPAREALPDLPEVLFEAMDDVLASGEPYRTNELPVTRHWTGEAGPRERFFDVSYSAVATETGRGNWGVCMVAVEVTDRVAGERVVQRRLEIRDVLRQAKAAVGASLDPAADLQALAGATVPGLADAAAVYRLTRPLPVGKIPTEPVTTDRVAVSAIGELGAVPVTGVRVCWEGDQNPVSRVIGAEAPLTLDTPSDAVPGWSVRTGSAAAIRSGVHQVSFVPVVVNTQVVAVAVFGVFGPRAVFDADDLDALAEVGRHGGAVMANSLAYQHTRQTSLLLQHSLLATLPAIPGLDICARYRPGGLDEVGGDFYDLFSHSLSHRQDAGVSAVVGDVVGHGVEAAAAMGRLRSTVQTLSFDGDGGRGPAAILDRLAAINRHAEITGFATLVYLRLRRDGDGTWRGRWARAGHLPPILLTPGGTAHALDAPAGAALVAAPLPGDARREEREVALAPGATLVCYTDGLLERPGVGLDTAIAELTETIAARAGQPIERMCEELMQGAPERDDAALLAIRVPGLR
jgi:hypothetical protein